MATVFNIGGSGSTAQSGDIAVPDVLGWARTNAENEIAERGLKSVVIPVEGGEGDEIGTVYDQDPRKPKLVAKDSTVTLYVYKAAVPDVIVERFDKVDKGIEQILKKLDGLSGGSTTPSPGAETKK
ncbi:PASTA domain-containing protein [Mycobacterium sp. MMS18-G62]